MNTIKPNIANIAERTRYNKTNINYNDSKQQISFKSGPLSLLSSADKKILNVFSQHYGKIGERLLLKSDKLINTAEIFKKSSRFASDKGALYIRDKKIGQSLIENVIFPFINLPLYAASWIVKKMQSIPIEPVKNWAAKVYKKPILRFPRKLNELDARTDQLKGIFEKTKDVIEKFAKEKGVSSEYLLDQLNKTDDTPAAKKLVAEASDFIKENLYKVSNKFFDKYTGNFNTAYERPLNRIVSGLVPVIFLANDAYNLSVLCGDKKEVSEKEARERRKQEISRVFITAYIQLLTFGAFTKQVNTIPWFTPLTSAATVLFSEIVSRKRLGKPIFFLSKEKAKAHNQKKANSTKQTDNTTTQKGNIPTEPTKQQINTFFNYKEATEKSKVFTSFKASDDKKPTESEKKEEPKKALINFKTFKNAIIFLVSAGFILSFLKNSSFTKDSKLVQGIKNIGNKIKDKIYNPLAFKDFAINEKDFEQVTTSLKEAGCEEVAKGHEFIMQKYGKTVDGVIKMYKSSLSSAKIPEIIDTVAEKLKTTGVELTDKEYSQISQAIKTAISSESTSIAENKFEAVAKKVVNIIKNKQINVNAEQLDDISQTITDAIAKGTKEIPMQVETKIKPFVDVVTEPFKFIFSALKLPFTITSSLLKMAVSPIENKAQKALVENIELTKFEKGIHRVVTEIFGEKAAKSSKISQTVFVNAMEQLEKRTMPYRKAEATLAELIKNAASEADIKKAKDALNKAKNDLLIYVNTAVEKSFNGVTQSSNKNTDLAMMSKLASSAVTSAFLVADNYNMVMLKSNGENKEGAKEKANERIIQRLSALFYQTMLIHWFNATFRSTYNSSLKGMAAVVIPNTLTTEILTRKSIGMPIGRKSLKELEEIDEKNENRKGFLGKYFKFMRLLTGKKPLSQRLQKDNKPKISDQTSTSSGIATTNLLQLFSKK